MASVSSSRLVPVNADRLQLGMFVAELDRPWLQTPFRPPGILLSHAEQIEEIQRLCEYVYVDLARGDLGEEDFFASGLTVRLERPLPLAMDPTPAPAPDPGANEARAALRELAHALAAGLKIARHHEALPLAHLRRALDSLLTAMEADPDLGPWLTATELKTGLIYRRAIDSAVHMALFARRLGMSREMTAELALGALILDVGKVTIPVPILAKPGPLSEQELGFVRRHVRRGLYLVSNGAFVSDPITEVCLGHHERLDGSGYPRGIRGTQIPLTARMAGLVDTFGALVQDRHYASALSPHDALRRLHTLRGSRFDSALLREFIRGIGVYPTGGWVQLADGRLGIVRSQVPDEPYRPRIALISDSAGRALPSSTELWTPRRREDIARAPVAAELRLSRRTLDEALAAASLAA